jgi:transcription elongation factor S-II
VDQVSVGRDFSVNRTLSRALSIMSARSTVEGIRISLSKLLPAESLSAEDLEQCKEMLNQLDKVEVSLDILTKTLIGTVVSKFKTHETVGPLARALVKKWKKVAKADEAQPSQSTAKAIKKIPKPSDKAERRESVSSAVAEAEIEWAGLQPHRQTTARKLHSFMLSAKASLVKQGINATAVEHLAVERATEVEAKIHEKFLNNRTDYLGKARSMCFNIKQNVGLTTQILLGQIEAGELVDMTSEQLASDEARKEREERARKFLDTSRLDWDQANEDKINEMCGIKGELLKASLFTCGRCKSIKTTSTQKQTRSADEPMTVFVLCLNCGKRWKC